MMPRNAGKMTVKKARPIKKKSLVWKDESEIFMVTVYTG